jgi:Domain of unknown function (DUF4160)
MPRLSAFYGIAVYMYFSDHQPPHFHAVYGSDEAAVAIEDGAILAGKMPRRAEQLLVEWTNLHREELLANWQAAVNNEPVFPIEPLE